MRPLNVENRERSTERGAGIRDGRGVDHQRKITCATICPQVVPKRFV